MSAIVYVQLLNEAVEVYRPVPARSIGGDIYELGLPPDHDPDGEAWEFPAGSRVKCRMRTLDGKQTLVAMSPAG